MADIEQDLTTAEGAQEHASRVTELLQFPGGRTDLDTAAINTYADAHAAGKRLYLRMQPDLEVEGGAYKSWPGVSWRAEFADAETLVRFREELDLFLKDWFARQGAGGA